MHRCRGRATRSASGFPYLLSPREPGRRRRARFSYEHDKKLHVSPFFSLDQGYRWWFTEPGDELHVRIDLVGGRRAAVLGDAARAAGEELTNASLARALVRYPLMPQRVTALIHLAGGAALAEARAVLPQAAVRARARGRCDP